MPKITFDTEEIRTVLEKYARSKFDLTGNEDSYFDAVINEGGDVEEVKFTIDCREQEQGK